MRNDGCNTIPAEKVRAFSGCRLALPLAKLKIDTLTLLRGSTADDRVDRPVENSSFRLGARISRDRVARTLKPSTMSDSTPSFQVVTLPLVE